MKTKWPFLLNVLRIEQLHMYVQLHLNADLSLYQHLWSTNEGKGTVAPGCPVYMYTKDTGKVQNWQVARLQAVLILIGSPIY